MKTIKFNNAEEFIKSYLDPETKIDESVVVDIASSIDYYNMDYSLVYNELDRYLSSNGFDKDSKESLLSTLEEYYLK